jgi:hypothetical protein
MEQYSWKSELSTAFSESLPQWIWNLCPNKLGSNTRSKIERWIDMTSVKYSFIKNAQKLILMHKVHDLSTFFIIQKLSYMTTNSFTYTRTLHPKHIHNVLCNAILLNQRQGIWKFSQSWPWSVLCSGMWCHVVCCKSWCFGKTYCSHSHNQRAWQPSKHQAVNFLLHLLFKPENEGPSSSKMSMNFYQWHHIPADSMLHK